MIDCREKIRRAGDKNPCRAMLNALYTYEYRDAWLHLNRVCKNIFQDAYENAVKCDVYKHFAEKYCRTEFVRANAFFSEGTCHIIEFSFLGYLKEDAEFEENGLENLNRRPPVEEKFRIYEYEFVDYLK